MKTTKAHYKLFQAECRKWLRKFGLIDWRVTFFHEDWSESCGPANAWCRWNQRGRTASLCLATDWGWSETSITNDMIRNKALHEVCHLLMARITDMAECYVAKDEVEEEAHCIIRRIENVLLGGI